MKINICWLKCVIWIMTITPCNNLNSFLNILNGINEGMMNELILHRDGFLSQSGASYSRENNELP